MAFYAQPMFTTCYLSQSRHVHVNGVCTLIETSVRHDSLPFHFDPEDDES